MPGTSSREDLVRYRLLGRSGLRVSELALGTMTFGEDWGWGASEAECRNMFDAFVEAGGNFIDTANNYTAGTSERYVGKLIAAERDRFVVASKYSLMPVLARDNDDPNAGGNSRKSMRRSVEGSLRNLGTDHIDLLWVHAWDATTPVDEVMRGLDDLVRAGKVLYVGFSNTPAWVVARADTLAELRGWSRVVALQLPYSLARRDIERELLPMAAEMDLAVLVWGMLQGGALSGKYGRESGEPRRYEAKNVPAKTLEIAGLVVQAARDADCTPVQVALAWVRSRPHHTLIPILGARSAAQLREQLGCLDLHLSPELRARLDAATAIDLGFPSTFIESSQVRTLMFGNTFDKLQRRNT